VLAWLHEGGQGTAEEIAKAIKIRKEDALTTLTILEEEGKIVSEMRSPRGKGRPKRVYFGSRKNGNENPPLLEPAKIAGQSASIFVPPAPNGVGTKITPREHAIDGALSDSLHFRSPIPLLSDASGNEMWEEDL
jgi:hypothetical protein